MSGVFASGLDFWARIGGKAASPRQATHGQTIRNTRTHFPFIAPLASNGALATRSWAPVVWHVVRRIADILPCPERRRCNSRATTASPDGLIRPAHDLQANCPLSLPSSCALRSATPKQVGVEGIGTHSPGGPLPSVPETVPLVSTSS